MTSGKREFSAWDVWMAALVGLAIGLVMATTAVESEWPNCAVLGGPAELRPRVSLPEDGDTGVPMRYCLCDDSRSEEGL